MNCAFCAADLDLGAARSCSGCSIAGAGGGCRSVCCPSCGYQTPLEPPMITRLRGWLSSRAPAREAAARTTLADMRPGEHGMVVKLETGGGDAAQARKLMALGVLPGCAVELDRRSPAFVLRLGYTRLAIDEALARSVVVRLALVALMLLAGAGAASAAEKPIQDNSFFVEEAYNQEPGVIQHISTFTRDFESDVWVYSFTEEWPLFGQEHQLSVTLPIESGAGLGDVLVNYRLQLSDSGRIAAAPRLTAILPTGHGGAGAQMNLPISIELPVPLVVHLNVGATARPGEEKPITAFAGASLVWLAHARFNVLVESFGQLGAVECMIVSPGVRAAFDLASLQIVPGIAMPIHVGPGDGEVGVFAYLSFEHPIAGP